MNEIQQDTQEWLNWRSQGIGASEAPDIMGVGYLTPYKLWSERLGLIPKRASNPAMQRGKDLEETARKEFMKMTDIWVEPALFVHMKYEWMRCSLDGISACGEHIVEIKCPNKVRHEMALNGKIPPEYYPQLQHQIEVCGVDKCFYFSFNGESGTVLEIFRDEKYISNLVSKEQRFWECLKNFEAPDLIDRDYEIKEDEEWKMHSEEWKNSYQMLKKYEEQEAKHRKTLIQLAGQSNVMGNGIRLSRSTRRGLIQYKEIPELKDVDLEQYRKPITETFRISQC